MNLRVAVDNVKDVPVSIDLCDGDGAEFSDVTFVGLTIRSIRFWKLTFDGQRNTFAHLTLAIAAVNDHIKFTINGKLKQIAGD